MRVYIDCGYAIGHGYKHYVSEGLISEDWTKIGFEPRDFETPEWVTKAAVSNYDGETDLFVHGLVTTIDKEFKSLVEKRPFFSGKQYNPPQKIRVVNVVELVKNLLSIKLEELFIKIDAEGVEYVIVEELLREEFDCKTTMAVEFHDRFYDDDKSSHLIAKMHHKGIKYIPHD